MADKIRKKGKKATETRDYKEEARYWKQKYDALRLEQSHATQEISVFQTICEHSRNPIFLIEVVEGKDYILRFANEKALVTEGKAAADIMDRDIISTFPLIKEKGLFDAMQKVYHTGIPLEFPFVVREEEKILEWKNTYVLKLSDHYLSFIYRDETEQKRKDLTLKENKERLEIAMQSAQLFYFENNFKTGEIDIDKKLFRALGYKEEDEPSRLNDLFGILYPKDIKDVEKALKDHFDGKNEMYQAEYRVKTKKGNYIWISGAGKAIERDREGNVLRFTGISRIIDKEKNAELELRASERKFKNLVHNSPTGIIQIDNQGKIIELNKRMGEIMGAPSIDEILGKNIHDFPNLKRAGVIDDFDRCLSTAKSLKKETPYYSYWGKKMHVRYYFSPIFDKQGKTSGIISVVDDITDQKIIESELQVNKEKFEALATMLPEVIYETDEKGNLSFVNLKAFEIFGYNQEEFNKGLSIFQMLAPEEQQRAKANFGKALKTGNIAGHEYLAIKKNGKRFPILIYANPILEEGKIKGLRGLLINISRMKETESKLRNNEELLRQLAENIEDAFWLQSNDNKVIYFNPASHKISGRDIRLHETNREMVLQWIHPDDRKNMIKELQENYKYPDHVHQYQHRIIRPDGQVRWIDIRTFPVYNEEGDIYRRAGIASDVTEQIALVDELTRAKEKAEESDRLKSAFLANMSHEIRTPMNGIMGFADLLKDENLEKEEREEFIDIIFENGKQLLNIIDDIIDVAKIEAGQMRMDIEEINLKDLLNEVYLHFQKEKTRWSEENIKFNLDLPKNENYQIVYADRSRLKQVLYNLLSNAFKFTPKGRVAMGYTLEKEENRPLLKIFIQDTGIGIPEEQIHFLFRRFHQIDYKSHRPQEGTGLGLAISKGIIELMNGSIGVESTYGKGSTFTVSLPVDIKNSLISKTQHEEDKKTYYNWEGKKILIVEDNYYNAIYLQKLLRITMAEVLIASSGEECLEILEKSNFDLVLMDIQLPGIDGYEATRRIKKKHPALPIIAQTAYAMENDRKKAKENGMDDYIAKPIRRDVLFTKINMYFY